MKTPRRLAAIGASQRSVRRRFWSRHPGLRGLLGNVARSAALAVLLLVAVTGLKAWHNRRDVVGYGSGPLFVGFAGAESFSVRDPYAVAGRWFKVQLHVHTDKSIDGRWSLEDALDTYAAAGYDFIAVTDHDQVTMPDRVPRGLLVIPAEENTVSFPFWPLGQHAVHLFAQQNVKRGSASTRFAAMVEAGGVVSIAHPNWPGNAGTGHWELKHLLAAPQFTLMEVNNPYSNSRLDTKLWHELLTYRGPDNPVWAVAVDDAHEARQADRAWTMVLAEEHTLDALRDALLRGSLYATTGPLVHFSATPRRVLVSSPDGDGDGATTVTAALGHEVTFIDHAGDIVHRHRGALPAVYTPTGSEGFIRVEVVSLDNGARAWSQPFWIVANSTSP